MADDMYNCLVNLIMGTKRDVARMKHSRGGGVYISKSPLSLVAYKCF